MAEQCRALEGVPGLLLRSCCGTLLLPAAALDRQEREERDQDEMCRGPARRHATQLAQYDRARASQGTFACKIGNLQAGVCLLIVCAAGQHLPVQWRHYRKQIHG